MKREYVKKKTIEGTFHKFGERRRDRPQFGQIGLQHNPIESTEDANRTMVNNTGRAIIKKISIKIEGNEVHVYSLDGADVYNCFKDLWLIKRQLENLAYQGIESHTKLQVGAGDALTDANEGKDQAIADASGINRFYVPLDFKLLMDHQPFYQAGLTDRLSYELTFNNYSKVVSSTDVNAKYIISGISLEYGVVTNAELSRMIKNLYSGKMTLKKQFRLNWAC